MCTQGREISFFSFSLSLDVDYFVKLQQHRRRRKISAIGAACDAGWQREAAEKLKHAPTQINCWPDTFADLCRKQRREAIPQVEKCSLRPM